LSSEKNNFSTLNLQAADAFEMLVNFYREHGVMFNSSKLHRLRVSQKGILRVIFRPEENDELTGSWRK
jgi:hypothetical protein